MSALFSFFQSREYEQYRLDSWGSTVLWREALTVTYKTSMEAFQYCPVKCCAVDISASTIASDNSFECDSSKCEFTDDQIEISHGIEFNLSNQFSLNVCANICDISGEVSGNFGTIRSNLSASTLATSQSILPKTAHYLTPIQTPPSSPTSTKKSHQHQ